MNKKRYFVPRGTSAWADDDSAIIEAREERDAYFEGLCGQINDLMAQIDNETQITICLDILDHASLKHGEKGKTARDLADDIRGLLL